VEIALDPPSLVVAQLDDPPARLILLVEMWDVL
jgi:hypothetical protein